ncbi:MAG: DoxX family membrane protein [Chitinivibrionia bacterium]|nr:DoxX family membrane protein [Chitinivibrionia bacterium]
MIAMLQAAPAESRRNALIAVLSNAGVIFSLRLLLGALFVYASYDKIAHPHQFAIAVRAYKIIPVEYSNLFALMLAWSEMIAGVFIIAGVFTKQAASAIFIMLFMFIAAIVISLIRGLAIDCGCFKSKGGHGVDYSLLVRDILLLAAAFLVMRFERGYLTIQRVFAGSR